MAAEKLSMVSEDIKNEKSPEISNIFASEFNKEEMHDRVLCFHVIDDAEVRRKGYSGDSNESVCESPSTGPVRQRGEGLQKRSLPPSWSEHESNGTESPVKSAKVGKFSLSSSSEGLSREWCSTPKPSKESANTPPADWSNSTTAWSSTTNIGTDGENKENRNFKECLEQNENGKSQHESTGEEQKIQSEGEERQETTTTYQNKKVEGSCEDGESKTNENKSIVSKLFVHSQWLAVQSSYFKALFYSGMKETYSKEVVMQIYEHELEAHRTFIEAMYRPDVLKEKDYPLVVQVLVLAHKYDARHVFKKCKYVLLSTTPSLEMSEYILKEIKHLSDTADIHEMLEKFLVMEFSPFDEIKSFDNFFNLSEAALRLLLRSDNFATLSEDVIFVALMKWVELNVPCEDREKCDLLDLVRFEFLSVDFLYDEVQDHIVASQMPGLSKYVVKGLAYRAFSEARREQLKPKPKKRPVEIEPPTFSWLIDERLERRLTRSPGTIVYSNNFLYQGYSMQLRLSFAKDLNTCSFCFTVCDLNEGARLYITYKAKSDLFAKKKIKTSKRLYTNENSNWGFKSLDRDKTLTKKCFTVDIWVEIHK